MKTEQEVRDLIKKITDGNQHILDQRLADMQTNVIVSLMQLSTISKLDALYFVLGEERPRYEYDKK